MGKKQKSKVRRRKPRPEFNSPEGVIRQETEGVHAFMAGFPPGAEKPEEMTKIYQLQLRKSPMWAEIVKQFGPDAAEELLKQCRVELR